MPPQGNRRIDTHHMLAKVKKTKANAKEVNQGLSKFNLTMIHQGKNDSLCKIFITRAHVDKTKC